MIEFEFQQPWPLAMYLISDLSVAYVIKLGALFLNQQKTHNYSYVLLLHNIVSICTINAVVTNIFTDVYIFLTL